MIQRKQTLFLLVAAVLAVVCLSSPIAMVVDEGLRTATVYNLMWVDATAQAHWEVLPLFLLLLLAAALNVFSVFLYTRRPLQSRLSLVSIGLYVAWYIGLVVVSRHVAADASHFLLQWVVALPACSTVLSWMAHKAIQADERLVRAADRIR